MIGFAPNNKSIQSALCAPKLATYNLPLATKKCGTVKTVPYWWLATGDWRLAALQSARSAPSLFTKKGAAEAAPKTILFNFRIAVAVNKSVNLFILLAKWAFVGRCVEITVKVVGVENRVHLVARTFTCGCEN